MNVFWIEVLPNGKICSSSSAPKGVTLTPLAGGKLVEVASLCPPNETAYFDGQLVHIGKPTTQHHEYDYQLRQWVDQRDLAFYKTEQWAKIKKDRDAVEFGSFIYNGMEFDGDLDAQRRLTSYISVSKTAIAQGTPFSADFILQDNTVVSLTAEDFVNIELAKVQSVAAAFAKGVVLRDLIESATNKDQVLAINWDSF